MSFLLRIPGIGSRLRLTGFTDWHSHILPGVDDGVPTLDRALWILDRYERLGIADVWLTPHIMEDIPNQTDMLRSRFARLEEAYAGNVRLHLAAENMIDRLFLTRLDSDDVLPIGPRGDILLVETSYFNAPAGFMETLGHIRSKGYFPLLAHPERYDYIDSLKRYRELKESGVRFQLNLLSLTGYYGHKAKEKSRRLLAEGLYDHVGTDLHRRAQIGLVADMRLPRRAARLISGR